MENVNSQQGILFPTVFLDLNITDLKIEIEYNKFIQRNETYIRYKLNNEPQIHVLDDEYVLLNKIQTLKEIELHFALKQ